MELDRGVLSQCSLHLRTYLPHVERLLGKTTSATMTMTWTISKSPMTLRVTKTLQMTSAQTSSTERTTRTMTASSIHVMPAVLLLPGTSETRPADVTLIRLN